MSFLYGCSIIALKVIESKKKIHKSSLRIVYNDIQSIFGEFLLKNDFLCTYHQRIKRRLIEKIKSLHNIPTNIYGNLIIGNVHNLNLGSRPELKIHSISSESTDKNSLRWKSLRCHCFVLWNNIPLAAFREKITKWKPDFVKPNVSDLGFIQTICNSIFLKFLIIFQLLAN